MHTKLFTLALILSLFFTASLQAQSDFHLQVGMNVGGSALFHNINFQETPLYAQYDINKKLVKDLYGKDLTWPEFSKEFGLRSHYIMPRFGFSGHLTYQDWPVFVAAEAMSSPSTYTKMEFGVTVGMGQYWTLDDESWVVGVHGGYKFVIDNGFGSSTIVNSVGDAQIRKDLQEFFNPTNPLRSTRGNLFTLRTGIGKKFGDIESRHPLQVGIELYGELDLVDKVQRQARMTNVGATVYARFTMF
jgi:hypothetical protein